MLLSHQVKIFNIAFIVEANLFQPMVFYPFRHIHPWLSPVPDLAVDFRALRYRDTKYTCTCMRACDTGMAGRIRYPSPVYHILARRYSASAISHDHVTLIKVKLVNLSTCSLVPPGMHWYHGTGYPYCITGAPALVT